MRSNWFAAAASALALALCGTAAQAQDTFYAGKTVSLVIPASAGGSYGTYALLLSDALSKHIPGKPAVVPQYVSGAGGMRASNQVANASEKDGTVIYMMHQNAATQQLLSPDQVSYDAAKFIPIGIVSSLNSAMAVRKDAPATEMDGFKQTEVLLGSTGRGSYQFVIPTLMNEFQGTKFKVITGYPGTGETMLAVDRAEVHGMLSSLLTFQESRPDWVDGSGDAKLVYQIGETKDPSIPDVPLLTELATSEQERALYSFMSASNSIGRAIVAPDGVPEDRIAVLRTALEQVLADPEFQDLCRQRGVPLASAGWEDLQAIIEKTLATPPEVVEVARKYMSEN
ncbi:Bug family tripartite tricarboxylate transporter substrate binding protein [Faunimonas sp. B44]|uniref:Bug family tripartite tricarboxylate transporter substrate binding protein n=1 Tax=Faunimonas sp. B44 TaxID=3461493 RepID=UPI0040443C9F